MALGNKPNQRAYRPLYQGEAAIVIPFAPVSDPEREEKRRGESRRDEKRRGEGRADEGKRAKESRQKIRRAEES